MDLIFGHEKPGDPEIEQVDRIDNSAVVTFKDGVEAVFPATLLHAAVGVAEAMHEKDLEEEAKQTFETSATD